LLAPENYVLTGKKWFGPNPMEEDYLINVNTSDVNGSNGSVEAFRNAVIGAGNTWSNAGAKFAFRYGGATGITTSAYDEKNVIRWEDMGSTSTLAEATWWSYSGGQIIEVDIRFNDHYSWDATGSPSGSEPDVQSIATHEMGHWLSLNHDDDPSCSGCPSGGPVMCRCYTMGSVKRTLASSDIAGIKALYGSQSPSTATPTPTATPTATPTRTSTRIPDSEIKDRRYLPVVLH